MTSRKKASANLFMLTVLGLLLFSTNSNSQEVDTIDFKGEQYFVYPFKIMVEEHSEYYDLIDHKYESKKAKKKSGKEPEFSEIELELNEILRYSELDFYKPSRRSKMNGKYAKAARTNPYPLLQQTYRYDYDLIPSLDPIPDGQYVQLFEDFCLVDKKGRCQEQVDRVAGVFILKDNKLEGEAIWMDVKGDTLKSGNFVGGLKEGIWRLEQRDMPYSIRKMEEILYAKRGYPFIDTSVMFKEYKSGVISGKYKRYSRSEFPVAEGAYLEGNKVGEWLYRDVLLKKVENTEYGIRDRVNSKVTSRFTRANVSDSIIVKQPWIRDELVSHYNAPDDVFNFYPKYSLERLNRKMFVMAFEQEPDLELEDEQYGSYEGGSYGNSGHYRDYMFSDYQATVYDDNRDNTFKRGYIIDSIGMIARYDGVMEAFYPNGQLKYRFIFENGKLLKEDTIFWDNGQAHDVINLVADSNHYLRSIYDYDGLTFKELVYDSLGDYVRTQYFHDNQKYVFLDGFKAEDNDHSDYFVFNIEDTLYHELDQPLELYRSWYKDDSSIIRRKLYDPTTQTLSYERFNALGKPKVSFEKTFGADFESWTGKTAIRYSDLEIVNTESGTFKQYWTIDTFPQDNVKYPYRRFDVGDEYVLFKNGQEYTGEVKFNFDKKKLNLSKDGLEIDFAPYRMSDKMKDKQSRKINKMIAKYRQTGKISDEVLLNYVNSSDHRDNLSYEIYSEFFKDLLVNKFSIAKSSYSGPYRNVTVKNSKLPKTDKVVGYMMDGKPHGTWKSYDQYGNVMKEIPYNKGELDGQAKYYQYEYPKEDNDIFPLSLGMFADSFPEKRTNFLVRTKDYKNGNRHGHIIEYDWMGGILSKEEYKEDRLDGPSIERNKLAYSRSVYRKGALDGYVQTYLTLPDRDSILLYDLNFQGGSLQGESKSYHLNGNISKKGFFLDGEPIEDYEAYDSLGFKYHYVKFKYSYPIEEKIWEENELSVRYLFDWEDSVHFEPSDITTSQSLERMLIDLGFGGSYLDQPYYGRPSLVEKEYIAYHMTKYYPNDTVARDGKLDHGKKVGLWKFYDYEGELLYFVDYKDSILNINDSIKFKSKGIYYEVDENEDTLFTAHIIEKFEKYDCSHTDHYEIRQLYTIWQASDSIGRMNGYVRNYYDNGVLQNEGQLKDGLAVGAWKIYDPFGKLNQYGMYVSGKRDGRWLSGDLSKTKYLGDICLNPNLPDLESEIKYRENLLDITITNYKLGRALNKQFYDVDMNRFEYIEE